jgi:UDP-N-acetylmuramoylalanine--D-glutamate ligase
MRAAGVELEKAKVVVMGMAKSGLAAAALLHGKGAAVTACDVKPLQELGALAGELRQMGAGFRIQSEDCCLGQDLVVISPGVPADAAPLRRARAAGIPVIGELELASYFLLGPVIGLTGSNGKSTTTAMTGHLLGASGIPVQVGGNIGTPPSAMVTNSKPDQWNVLELSSFQLETISHFRAGIGVALNLTPDHLDRHGSMEAYRAAKARLFETQEQGAYAVLNADDPMCSGFAAVTRGLAVWFSQTRAVTPGAWVENGTIYYDGQAVLPVRDIPLRGRHNVENTLAAVATARLAGANLDQIAAAIRTFPGVEHRLEFVTAVNGVEFYNDSKATNVDAALKAVAAFEAGLWIILGGKDKDSDYTPLREPLRARAKAALLIGAATEKIAGQLEGATTLVRCGDLAAALDHATANGRPGDTVLLAPACASFDQFENFEHRGRTFKQLVREFEKRKGNP